MPLFGEHFAFEQVVNRYRRNGNKRDKMTRTTVAILLFLGLCPLTGCVVGQAPGKGRVLHVHEATTGGWYWLYLPEDYIKNEQQDLLTHRRWPLVVTFHGMKPFDNANPQIREWQQEADRYGFVVCAPECTSPDLVKQFPLRDVHPGVRRDEALTIAAMNDITRSVDIDPDAVLSTSWSSGGYLAHYMANRHPERFSCVGVRQSNFSSAVLDPGQVPKYRSNKIGIFYTENDIAVCRRESQEAAHWYHKHGFDVTFAVFKGLGHERRPGPAAAFFASTCGAKAKTPPIELAQMQVTEIPLAALARANGSKSKQVSNTKEQELPLRKVKRAPTANSPESAEPPTTTVAASQNTKNQGPDEQAKPENTSDQPDDASGSAVRVKLNTTIGIAPLSVSFSAIAPPELRSGAYYLWTDNGMPIANGMNGQRRLSDPGRHEIEVLMTTANGNQHRASQVVTVLERIGRRRSTRR